MFYRVWPVRAIAKLEKRVKELLKTIEDLKEVQIRRLEAKDAEISELKCTIIQMMQKVTTGLDCL